MDDSTVKATFRMLIDAQAWLYAQLVLPEGGSEADHQALQDEWKRESAAIVEGILAGEIT